MHFFKRRIFLLFFARRTKNRRAKFRHKWKSPFFNFFRQVKFWLISSEKENPDPKHRSKQKVNRTRQSSNVELWFQSDEKISPLSKPSEEKISERRTKSSSSNRLFLVWSREKLLAGNSWKETRRSQRFWSISIALFNLAIECSFVSHSVDK